MMKSCAPSPALLACRSDVVRTLKKHEKNLDATEILALMAHITGQVVAAQDKDKITPEKALSIILSNVETGNAEAVAQLMETVGNA